MDELKFDTMEGNMKLAEDFLATHNAHLEKLQSLYKVNDTIELKEFTNMDVDSRYSDDNLKLKKLMKKLQENAELIAQLVMLKQGRVKEDVLNYDLKLIEENIKYWCNRDQTNVETCFRCVDNPLAFLGYAADLKMLNACELLIKFNSLTLPVTYLFARLCCQVGIYLLMFLRCAEGAETKSFSDAEFNGCTAVVCEQADMDSAVDSILASTLHDPWRIHRVYVQESVYDDVKRAFSWKCGLKDKQEASDKLNLVSLKYGNKTLIFDYVGREKESSGTYQTIFVEAFRTVKELLSLLEKGSSFCLSVWSSDVSVSNEIALNVISPIVWINDYGTVDGPVTRAFYTTFTPGNKIGFCKQIDDWTKLGTNERVENIYKSLEQFKSENNDSESRDLVNKIKKVLKYMPSNKSFENTNGKMWINMEIPKGVVFITNTEQFDDEYMEELLISAARGNVLVPERVLEEKYTDNSKNLLLYLSENSPFFYSYDSLYKLPADVTLYDHYRVRVIVINYGTIFAN